MAPRRPPPPRHRLRPLPPVPPPLLLLLPLSPRALRPPPRLAPITIPNSPNSSSSSAAAAAAIDVPAAGVTTSLSAGEFPPTTRVVRRVRRRVGGLLLLVGSAAAVRGGDVPVHRRGVRLRIQRPAGLRLHAVAMGAAWLPPTQVRAYRFNATDFLGRLRGKRLMLVGDSMNRNQFESLLCILREALPDKSRMFETHGYRITKGRGYFVFKFVDYDCTVEFVRSHFLVREGVRYNRQRNSNPILQIDRIDKTASRWRKVDVLVFNTGHWWTHGKTARGKNYYKEGNTLYPQFDSTEAYRRALKTWARWIDKNMDPAKSVVFYRGYSTAHFRGGEWDSGGSCNGETEPTFRGSVIGSYPLKMRIAEEVIRKMKFPVRLLNVTKLTNFRKDGHPSVYGKAAVATGKKVSRRKQDCSHWCLPGVPDAWNELIYASLVLDPKPRSWKQY
uniref:Trichome birefringence-like C-terminal domain-containing protein n=1 Tax=Leersia perrieri TaxID=77586 RepID=A0A0D9WSV0_9ORYZ